MIHKSRINNITVEILQRNKSYQKIEMKFVVARIFRPWKFHQ